MGNLSKFFLLLNKAMRHSLLKLAFACLCCLPWLLSPVGPVKACTLWARLGERAKEGAVLVGKTRDMPPNHAQELRLERPAGGYRFLGLYAANGPRPGLKDGINENGLVIVNAAASCLSQAERNRFPGPEDLMEKLLATCADVEAVLQKRDWFSHPAFFLIADPTRVALIETGLDRQQAGGIG